MATLNIMCAICNEFYKTTDSVYSTICGHVFHQGCLMRWLARSSTCPQCRRSCHRQRVHRIFLNFGERTELDDEIEAEQANEPLWMMMDSSGGPPTRIPDGAVKSGSDPDGHTTYVARCYYAEDLLPANFVSEKGGTYAPYCCTEHFVDEDYELLIIEDPSTIAWEPDMGGHVPTNAIITGYTETGENLYTGRAQYEGITLAGKVHPSHGVLYMPYKGLEVNVNQYEVLVKVAKQSEPEPVPQSTEQ